MKSSLKVSLVAAALFVSSLAPKLILGVLRAEAAPPPARGARLRAFLVTASDGTIEAVGGDADGRNAAGWRFQADGCKASAFPSGPRGTFDLAASAEARITARAHMSYVYRSVVTSKPPARLAIDVMLFRLLSPFSPSKATEPGYVVVVSSGDCPGLSRLPWRRFRPN